MPADRVPRMRTGISWVDSALDKWADAIDRANGITITGNVRMTRSRAGASVWVPGVPIALARTGADGIPPRVGATPGKGTINLQQFNGTTLVPSPGRPDVAYNFSGNTPGIGGNKYGIVVQINGVWWPLSWEC